LIAWSLLNLGALISLQGDLPRAEACLDESLALFMSLDDPHGVNNALRMWSGVAIRQGEIAHARQLLDEVLRHSSESGHAIGLAQGHELLGRIAWIHERNKELARTHLRASLSQYVESGGGLPAARVHVSLALVEHEFGNRAEAQRLVEEAMRLLKETGYLQLPLVDYALYGVGFDASKHGDYQRAAALFAAAELGVKNDTFWLEHAFVHHYDQDVGVLRQQLGDAAFAEAWAVGKAMTREQAIAFALESDKPSTRPAPITD
jgi:tetratricopeptide (TPR) repeat protein